MLEEARIRQRVGVDDGHGVRWRRLCQETVDRPSQRAAFTPSVGVGPLPDLGTGFAGDSGGGVAAVVCDDDHAPLSLRPSLGQERTHAARHQQLLVVRGYEHREPMPRAGGREAWRPESGQRKSEEISAAEQRRHGGHR